MEIPAPRQSPFKPVEDLLVKLIWCARLLGG